MKHTVVAMELNTGAINVNGVDVQAILPDGCIGFFLVFESKKTARKYCGNDVKLLKVKYAPKEEPPK